MEGFIEGLISGLLVLIVGLLIEARIDRRKANQELQEKDDVLVDMLTQDLVTYIGTVIATRRSLERELKRIDSNNPEKRFVIATVMPINYTPIRIGELNKPKQLEKLEIISELRLMYSFLDIINTLINAREGYYAQHYYNPEVHQGLAAYDLRILTAFKHLLKVIDEMSPKVGIENIVSDMYRNLDEQTKNKENREHGGKSNAFPAGKL